MKNLSARLALLLAVSCFWATGAAARELVDSTGARVRLPETPQRVITLIPSLGELAADLLGEELQRIVGVSEYTDYPPALKKVASIGPYHKFNLEQVTALKPDLVLASLDGNPKDQVLHLRELGVPVFVVATSNFAQVEESMRLVADALAFRDKGVQMARRFREGLARIQERGKKRTSKPRILLQLGDEPIVVAGRESFLNEAIETIGATNAYSDLKARYPKPSLEDVTQRRPDYIFVLALGRDTASFKRMAARWSRFPQIPAVKQGRVYVLEADSLLRPSLRLLEGLSILEKRLSERGLTDAS